MSLPFLERKRDQINVSPETIGRIRSEVFLSCLSFTLFSFSHPYLLYLVVMTRGDGDGLYGCEVLGER